MKQKSQIFHGPHGNKIPINSTTLFTITSRTRDQFLKKSHYKYTSLFIIRNERN